MVVDSSVQLYIWTCGGLARPETSKAGPEKPVREKPDLRTRGHGQLHNFDEARW